MEAITKPDLKLMKSVFVNSCNIISSLGLTTDENYLHVKSGKSGVQLHKESFIDSTDEVRASLVDDAQLEKALQGIHNTTSFTRYEKLLAASVNEALGKSGVAASSNETLFVFSTTKGNISMLEDGGINDGNMFNDEISLFSSAQKVATCFNNSNKPVVISNACISGVVALLYARRILNEGNFKHVIVIGADCINSFIYSGFASFQALSPGNCKPFSNSRDGINLGEAAATIILTTNENCEGNLPVEVMQGAITNDSNHISGPSRTGEELAAAISNAIHLSGLHTNDIGFISAHGTATSFNDEMEAKAIDFAGMKNTPVNSLKGYFGHTLGAAGLVETIISIQSMIHNELIPTIGFESPPVSPAINVIASVKNNTPIHHFIKTASGFGGCNAALVFSKS